MTDMACGPVRSTPGTPVQEIVVSGGFFADSHASKTVDIFNIGTASWRSGIIYTNANKIRS